MTTGWEARWSWPEGPGAFPPAGGGPRYVIAAGECLDPFSCPDETAASPLELRPVQEEYAEHDDIAGDDVAHRAPSGTAGRPTPTPSSGRPSAPGSPSDESAVLRDRSTGVA